MRKLFFFCICENKAADQLCGNRTADQHLCFRYTDSIFPLLSKSEISSLYEGHSRINDNEVISRKVLIYSVLFIMPHEDTYITYLCLKFGAFIMVRFDAMMI